MKIPKNHVNNTLIYGIAIVNKLINSERKMSYYDYDEYEDEYAGTYAHDVEGFSDEDTDTIFDGDTDAYWNID